MRYVIMITTQTQSNFKRELNQKLSWNDIEPDSIAVFALFSAAVWYYYAHISLTSIFDNLSTFSSTISFHISLLVQPVPEPGSEII